MKNERSVLYVAIGASIFGLCILTAVVSYAQTETTATVLGQLLQMLGMLVPLLAALAHSQRAAKDAQESKIVAFQAKEAALDTRQVIDETKTVTELTASKVAALQQAQIMESEKLHLCHDNSCTINGD